MKKKKKKIDQAKEKTIVCDEKLSKNVNLFIAARDKKIDRKYLNNSSVKVNIGN